MKYTYLRASPRIDRWYFPLAYDLAIAGIMPLGSRKVFVAWHLQKPAW